MHDMARRQPAEVEAQRGPWRALVGPVAIIGVLMILGRLAGGHWPQVETWVAGLGAAGYAVFCGAWVVLASACFPVSVLGISAGALFGLPLGLVLVFISAMAAALVMYGLARGLLRDRIRRLIAGRPRLAAVDRLAGEQALRLNVLTRLSPLNYGLVCYTLAVGRTSLRTYLLGNLATVPSMVVQVWLGTVAVETGKAAGGDGPATRDLILLACGLVFFAVLTWQIGRLVRQALASEDPGAPGTAHNRDEKAAE